MVVPIQCRSSRAEQPFVLLHSNVWQSPILSNAGFRYYVIFIDDYTRFSWIYFLRCKSVVYENFLHLLSMLSTQFSATVRSLRCDSGGEFVSSSMPALHAQRGINLQLSCPYTPQQNGVAERRHRHLANFARTMLIQSWLPASYWPDAFHTAHYLVNRMPSASLAFDVPYRLLHGKAVNYSVFRPFGRLCYPFLGHFAAHKLDPRSTPCVFLGYSDNHRGCRCLDPATGKVHYNRHVCFCDEVFPFNDLQDSPTSPATSLVEFTPLTLVVTVSLPSSSPPLVMPPPPNSKSSPSSQSSPWVLHEPSSPPPEMSSTAHQRDVPRVPVPSSTR
ncbi:hypothetical protein MLD38_006225 [Melastoma candidum]|uniref:Uncharacterized protein n=1 Tax=Melastoma candidum TaxID=119954 RepID=A0ACB9RP44_9MYRT|nr:hypothetical protein MLD38_006225 [Melastoma candidum]